MAKRIGLQLTRLEERAVPATYTVSLISPAVGSQGYSACKVIAGRLMVNPALDADGDGRVTVEAQAPAEAIRKAVVGRVMVNTRKLHLHNAIYRFGAQSSRSMQNEATSAKVPFLVSENLIRLEDLARFPKRADWDFNDTFWKVSVTEMKSVEGWAAFQEAPQPTPKPGQPALPEAHWSLTDGVLRTPEGETADPLLKGSLTQEGPRYVSNDDFQAFRMTVEYRGLDTLPIAPAPNGNRLPETNQHFSNSGVYIYDRYEVQIIDPTKFNLTNGQTGVPTGGELTGAIVNDANSGNVSYYVPGGLYGVPIASPDGHYWNWARPTGEWNDLEIDFKPAVLEDLDPRDPSKGQDANVALEPARITVKLNGMTVLQDAEIKDAAGPLKGTGSRARAPGFLVSGPVKLQSHWGSQVEFRNIRIEALPDC